MTNEKTNPMPYRAADAAAMPAAAGAAEAVGPDMAAPVITPDDVARGTELLRRYKDGKRALEARIIADEQWYRLRHWQYLRDRRREQGGDVVEPTSAWLFNAIVSKHADAMDSFPEAVILPRSEQDEPDAKALSAIVPAVLEKTHFEQVWSDAWWYKLKHGCAAYGVFWDSAGSNGLGDVAVRQLDLLNLFWEPGITDIQASRNLFVCALMDNDDISAAWPDARPGSCGVELAQYLYDDAVDTSSKSIVVDWYYKKPLPGGGTALHLIKFTGRDLLYASENDPAMAGGFYPHGQYPVVFDVLYPEAGTPCGFGMIAVSKDPQQYIDRLSGNLLEMSMKASTPRFWVKKGCGVNAQEFLDWSKPLVEVEGSIDDERLRQISLYNLDGQWVNMLQLKIDELKETSNSRDVTQGSVSGGVTAASAIAALQEAGSKSSRDTLRASYRAFERALMDNDDISAAWPDARPGSCGVELAQYLYDDAVDTSSKSIVVDWYYKKPLPGGGTALHLIKFTGRDLLYASENDPAMAGGFYPHGQYPVVFDVLYPEAGTPCGFGMIAVSKDPQQYIDRLSGNLLEMSMKASTPRFWVKKGCGVNAQEFLDWSKPLVEVEGSIDDERLRQISLYNLDGQWVNMLQLKIDELKETSNSRDVTQGSVSGGVTAASAIAALQEAGSKSSRDTLRASYRAFERVVELVIELIRAYYTETRPFRVAAPGAQGYAFCTYSNAGLQARTVGMDADGMALLRAPAFDVSVHAQKESPYATASQNELARQLYQLGVFNPAFAQQAVPMLEMMQFPGRDKVLEAVRSSIVPPQPETPDAGTDTSADPLLRAQAEKNRVITASAR